MGEGCVDGAGKGLDCVDGIRCPLSVKPSVRRAASVCVGGGPQRGGAVAGRCFRFNTLECVLWRRASGPGLKSLSPTTLHTFPSPNTCLPTKHTVRSRPELEGGVGGGSGTQKSVYQKWPEQIFPIVNFAFSRHDHFGLGSGGGAELPTPILECFSRCSESPLVSVSLFHYQAQAAAGNLPPFDFFLGGGGFSVCHPERRLWQGH